jgi:hypothetical protein
LILFLIISIIIITVINKIKKKHPNW